MLQDNLWEMEDVLLVGVLWNLSILNPKLENKRVSVVVSFGSMTQEGGNACSEPIREYIPSRIIVYTSDFRN
jgi:hypothetical protein